MMEIFVCEYSKGGEKENKELYFKIGKQRCQQRLNGPNAEEFQGNFYRRRRRSRARTI